MYVYVPQPYKHTQYWHSYKMDTFHNEKKGMYSKQTIVQINSKHTVPKLACIKETEDAVKRFTSKLVEKVTPLDT